MSVPQQNSQRRNPFSTTIIVLAILFVAFTLVAGFWTDWQWFVSVDYASVFTKQIVIKAALFFIVGVPTMLALWGSAQAAYRSRPLAIPMTPEELALQKYRDSLEPIRKGLFIVAPAIFGILAGISATSQWRTYLMWENSVPFGTKDPQFGRDISFYAFQLPFLRFILASLFTIVVAAGIVNVFIHYIYGGLRLATAAGTLSPARRQITLFLGLFVLLKAVAYSLDKYVLVTKSDSLISGLKYTDVHAVLPAKTLLSYIALATALLFFISLLRPVSSLPVIAFGVMLGASILIGGAYPAFVQQVQVKPSELQREAPYIQRNLTATRTAYGLNNVQVQEYKAIDNPSQATFAKDSDTLSNIRLLDPSLVSPTFQNLQQIRGFYAFPETLDIDRYTFGDQKRGTVIAVREVNLDGVADSQRNWFNDHMVFTHGYGAVAALDNSAKADGSPNFVESDIPPVGKLNIKQPRVYFGEQSPIYSIVGNPADGQKRELDYPDDKSANGQANNTYSGSGGVAIGNLFQRAVFALHYREANILLSNQITPGSRILYDRDPKTRIKKVAPWLTLDSDPYPAVINGRIQWIVDGYTTSNEYPYAARVSLRDATADSVSAQSGLSTLSAQNVTYMRNSVKATVDAYDGTVRIYEWDTKDPVLKVWRQAFPGVVEDRSAISNELLEHIRYPEDLYKVQRDILAKYHVKDPQAFYSGQDFWTIPDDPTKPRLSQAQPPYYMMLRMPDQQKSTFSLTSTFAPSKRQTLAAFMAVTADAGKDYGKIRILQLPRNTTIPGPTQVQNNFESDPIVSSQLSLLRQGGSEVELGNLLSLPVGGGLLYFEPVYVRASGGSGYPLLRRVLVSFGSKVAFESDLATALDKIFSGQVDVPTGGDGGSALTPAQKLSAALAEASDAYADGQAALAKSDFAAYGVAQKRLQSALARANAALDSLKQ